ncbi:hypothetical protein [Chryseobacterium sp. CFBP8996]|nr:hypothetical protein [Chryseobacterium sp. CFBP8996]MDY0933275.1 hypothetical protein [Chryseobacterium sp. CFBP8996]
MLYSPTQGYKEVIDGTDPTAKAKYMYVRREQSLWDALQECRIANQ